MVVCRARSGCELTLALFTEHLVEGGGARSDGGIHVGTRADASEVLGVDERYGPSDLHARVDSSSVCSSYEKRVADLLTEDDLPVTVRSDLGRVLRPDC